MLLQQASIQSPYSQVCMLKDSSPILLNHHQGTWRYASLLLLHGKRSSYTTLLESNSNNCDASICWDFNRFKTLKCTFNGSCVYGCQQICMFCKDQSCKAYFHVHGRYFQLQNLPKRNADTLMKLSQALKTCLETINNLKSQPHHRAKERNELRPSEANTLTKADLLQSKQDGILALPVMYLDKQVTMPVFTYIITLQ